MTRQWQCVEGWVVVSGEVDEVDCVRLESASRSDLGSETMPLISDSREGDMPFPETLKTTKQFE